MTHLIRIDDIPVIGTALYAVHLTSILNSPIAGPVAAALVTVAFNLYKMAKERRQDERVKLLQAENLVLQLKVRKLERLNSDLPGVADQDSD
jgi:hypothetical protein